MIEKLRLFVSQLFVIAVIILISVSGSCWEGGLISSILFFTGIIMVGIASLGRLWCSLYIAGYKTDKLIIEGPYSICRNPLYFFSFIGAIGVGFASETILIPLIVLIGFSIYYPFVINSEENQLKKLHKNEFLKYVNDVPKFFPKFSILKEPKEYVVKPIIFRRHMFDALWFIWFTGILEVIEELHELSIIPIIFKIY